MTLPTPHTARIVPSPGPDGAALAEIGRAARQALPRSANADLVVRPDRDPIGILEAQEVSRVADLVPVRHARMAISPFTFFRGAAAIMAADLAAGPSTGLATQACGDAHLANFGVFGTPERHTAFDVNDFDETLPAHFEWDVKRLCASIVVAARDREFPIADGVAAASIAAQAYRDAMADLSALPELERWYVQVNVEDIMATLHGESLRRTEKTVDKALRRTSAHAVAKLARSEEGHLRIVDDPPFIIHLSDELVAENLPRLLEGYRATLSSDRQHLLDRYRVVDVARKVVGVGSVGTRCYILLMASHSDDSPLFLQVKEAQPSVLEPYVGAAAEATSGERVVAGQRLMQASSDIFLGWASTGGFHFYLRQLRDRKGSVDLTTIQPKGLHTYAKVCGATLARAHARAGSAHAIAAYLGSGGRFAEAMGRFGVAYADLNAADHALFREAIADGRIEVAERGY